MYFMDVYMHITSSFSSVSLLGKLYLCVRSFNFAFQFRADVHCKQWHSACLQCVHLKRCVCVMLHWQKYSNVTQHTNIEIISFRLIEQLDGRWVLKRIRCFFVVVDDTIATVKKYLKTCYWISSTASLVNTKTNEQTRCTLYARKKKNNREMENGAKLL